MIVLKGRIRIRNFVPEVKFWKVNFWIRVGSGSATIKVWKVNFWNRAGRRFLEIRDNKMFGS